MGLGETRFTERNFLVTGAASGIGLHLANELLTRGCRVVAADLRLEVLQARARERAWPADRVLVRALDVRDPEAWERLVAEAAAAFGSLDCLLNVAGFLQPGWVEKIRSEDVHGHFDVNTKGVIFGTLAAARQMVRQGRGHVINIASIAGCVPLAGMSLYGASKYAVRGFSLAVAQELRPRGVAVTVICPDGVRTPMLEFETAYDESALVFSGTRLQTVEDMARAVLERALVRKPFELFVPSWRGWISRFGDLFPALYFRIEPYFRRKGLANLRALRRGEWK